VDHFMSAIGAHIADSGELQVRHITLAR
jgi:hypothetical protein